MVIPIEDECEKYNELHCTCPNCRGEDFDEGPGIAFSNPKSNPNKHTCKTCGWKGFQRDLLPKDVKDA